MEAGETSESFNFLPYYYRSLNFNFTVRSPICSRQMTSLFIGVYPDGIETASPAVSLKIPRLCFKNEGNSDIFSMELSNYNFGYYNNLRDQICSESTIDWKPLQECRQYKIIFQVEYSSKWKSDAFVWDTFISSHPGIHN